MTHNSRFDGLKLAHWKTETRADDIVRVRFDRADASVNAFSQASLVELDALVERMKIDPPKGVVFLSGKSNGFIAGADLHEFQSFDAKGTVDAAIRRGQTVFQKVATLPCTTVAAIHGFWMGGGTELALACTRRVATNAPSTRIGLPEVLLGIFPGWGGSVRLPRLIGAPAAFDLMLTGRAVTGKAALGMGLVDKVVDPAVLEDEAIALVSRGVDRPFKQRFMARATNLWPVRQVLAPVLEKQVARKAPKAHYPAPYALIRTWRTSAGGSIA